MHLFAYGTLMDRRILARVLGRTPPNGVPATLYGYKKWETTLGYPIILPETGAVCQGMVFYNLSQQDWKRLDEYEKATTEPPAYFRRLLSAQGGSGSISVQVYVGNLNYFRARLKR
ncbi:MAG TPA: gamma-glutamylcyclotransferase family protein [Symbiobacteriaceae bacterium]|nr:gamma-glutamylcyclotransferase family protein [Symbiobacteriaceae bacterium]